MLGAALRGEAAIRIRKRSSCRQKRCSGDDDLVVHCVLPIRCALRTRQVPLGLQAGTNDGGISLWDHSIGAAPRSTAHDEESEEDRDEHRAAIVAIARRTRCLGLLLAGDLLQRSGLLTQALRPLRGARCVPRHRSDSARGRNRRRARLRATHPAHRRLRRHDPNRRSQAALLARKRTARSRRSLSVRARMA